jgi:hypothetical protein
MTQLRFCALAPQLVGVGSRPDDGYLVGSLLASPEGDLAVGLIGGDDMVGRSERAPFEHPETPVRHSSPAWKAGLIQFGAKVVVVEDEAAAADYPKENA